MIPKHDKIVLITVNFKQLSKSNELILQVFQMGTNPMSNAWYLYLTVTQRVAMLFSERRFDSVDLSLLSTYSSICEYANCSMQHFIGSHFTTRIEPSGRLVTRFVRRLIGYSYRHCNRCQKIFAGDDTSSTCYVCLGQQCSNCENIADETVIEHTGSQIKLCEYCKTAYLHNGTIPE